MGFPSGKESTCNAGDAGDTGLIPGLGRSPEGGHGNPLQYPCLENPMNRGAWWAIDHRIAELDITEMTECVCARARAHACTHTHRES